MQQKNLICTHSLKNVQIPGFFWTIFSRIWSEYRDLPCKSPYAVQMRENTDQVKPWIRTLFRLWLLWTYFSNLKVIKEESVSFLIEEFLFVLDDLNESVKMNTVTLSDFCKICKDIKRFLVKNINRLLMLHEEEPIQTSISFLKIFFSVAFQRFSGNFQKFLCFWKSLFQSGIFTNIFKCTIFFLASFYTLLQARYYYSQTSLQRNNLWENGEQTGHEFLWPVLIFKKKQNLQECWLYAICNNSTLSFSKGIEMER